MRRFIAEYLLMLPVRKNSNPSHHRFSEYLLALAGGATGRIIEPLRRVATEALRHKSKSVGSDKLLIAGARHSAINNQHARVPTLGTFKCQNDTF